MVPSSQIATVSMRLSQVFWKTIVDLGSFAWLIQVPRGYIPVPHGYIPVPNGYIPVPHGYILVAHGYTPVPSSEILQGLYSHLVT